MDIVVNIIGILFVALSVFFIVKPQAMKYLWNFFAVNGRIYIVGILRFILAVIFLISARECHRPAIIIAIGIFLFIAGLIIFILGPKKLVPVLDWWRQKPLWVLRILALVLLAFGGLIIFSA